MSSQAVYICMEDVKRLLNAGIDPNNMNYNYNRGGGIVTAYEETGSRMRGHDFAEGYNSNQPPPPPPPPRNNRRPDDYNSNNARPPPPPPPPRNNRRDYHQGRSASPNRRRNSRGRDRSRSPHDFNERIYDDFAARDFDSGRPNRGNRGDQSCDRDYREGSRDNRHNDKERRPPRNRESRENRGGSREKFRDRDNRDNNNRDNNNRDNNRDTNRDNNSRDNNRDNNRDNRDNRDNNSRDNNSRDNNNRDNNNRDTNNRDYRDNSNRDNSNKDNSNRDNNNRDNNREPREQKEPRGNRDEDYHSDRDHSDRDHSDRDHSDRDRRRSRERREMNEYYAPRIDDNIPSMPPSPTVILQNIGQDCTEHKIEEVLKAADLSFRHIVVIRERTGENRGYAFVEFNDINIAEKWLKATKRVITIDGRTVQLNFSKSRKNDPNCSIPDWYCVKCNVLNFGSRKRHDKPTCYQCGALQVKPEHISINEIPKNIKEPAAGEVIKVEPCNVLMVRGMDFSTTEEMIRDAISVCTTKPIYDVRLIRDKITDMSRGFAFVEMGAVEDAAELLETVEKSDPPFSIVGRRITMGYARHGYNAPIVGRKGRTGLVSKQMAAENAVAQGSSSKATAEYSQSMADSYASAVLAGQVPTTAVATATAIAAAGLSAAATSAMPSSYTYDPTSGYYYDSSTSLYYDPNTGYYFNSVTQKWLFWNGSRYQAVNQDGTPVVSTAAEPAAAVIATATIAVTAQPAVTRTPVAVATPAAVTTEATAEEVKIVPEVKEKVEVSYQKPKTARKIAKDMERWAKKMNTATEARKIAVQHAQIELRILAEKEEELRQQILQEKTMPIIPPEAILPAKDNIRSLFVPDNDDEGSVLKLGSALSIPQSKKPKATAKVIVPELPEDDDFVDESKFVDITKMACLLCKRQFPSKDVLTKHLQISQLHKENLEKYKRLKQAS